MQQNPGQQVENTRVAAEASQGLSAIVPAVIGECIRRVETKTFIEQNLTRVGFVKAFNLFGNGYKTNITGPVKQGVVTTPARFDMNFTPSGCNIIPPSVGNAAGSFVSQSKPAFEAQGYTFASTGNGKYVATKAGSKIDMHVTRVRVSGSSFTRIDIN